MLKLRRTRQLPPLLEIEAASVCLIKPSALGDVVQTLPVLSALRQRFPQAHIAWVVNRAYAELLEGHPHLDEIIAFDRRGTSLWSRAGRESFRVMLSTLRRGQFDLTCDLQGLLRSAILTQATRARRKLGLGDAREGARWFYTDVVAVPAETTCAVDRYWLLAESLGAGTGPKQFLIAINPSDRDWARAQLAGLAGLRVAIHPGARWVTKRWPADHFADVAQRLVRETGISVVVVGGPEETAAARMIASAVRHRCVNLAGRTSLKQLASVLGEVDLLLTNDSGPMHLAAALGTPVAAIFTCTSPQRARPYGAGHLVLATRVWCAASYLKKCSRLDCMTELTPAVVWPALRDFVVGLAARSATRPADARKTA